MSGTVQRARLPDAFHSFNVLATLAVADGYRPVMPFPIFVAVERIERHVLESAQVLGASRLSTFRRVVFPEALPGLVAGCTLVWVPALGEYVIPTLLGGAKTFMVG